MGSPTQTPGGPTPGGRTPGGQVPGAHGPSPTPGPAKPSRLRKLGRILRRAAVGLLVTVVALLLVVALVLAWATQTRSGRAFVLAKVLGIVEGGVLDADLEVGELESVLGVLVLNEVRMAGPDGLPIVDAERLEVEYRIRPFLSNGVELPRISVQARTLDVRIGPDGALNLTDILPEPAEPKPPGEGAVWTVNLGDIDASVDRLEVWNGDESLAVVERLHARAAVDIPGPGVTVIEVASVSGDVRSTILGDDEPRALALEDADVTLEGADIVGAVGALTLGSSALRGVGIDLDAGDAGGFDAIAASIAEIVVDPSDVNPLIGDGPRLLGPIRLSADVRGPGDAVTVTVPVDGPGGRFQLRGTLDISDTTNLGYELQLALLRVRPDAWVDIELDVDVSAGISVVGRGTDPDTMNAVARLDIGPSRILGYPLDGAFAAVAYDAGTIELRTLDARSRSARVRLAAGLAPDGAVHASVDIEAPDLEDITRTVEQDTLHGSVDVDLELAGVLGFDVLDPQTHPTDVDGWIAAAGGIDGGGHVRIRGFDGAGAQVERVNLDWSAEGSEEGPNATLDLDARGVAVSGLDLDAADLRIDVRPDHAEVRGDVSLSDGGIVARLDVAADLLSDALDVRLREVEATVAGLDFAVLQPTRVVLDLEEGFTPIRATVHPTMVRAVGVDLALEASYGLRSGAAFARVAAASVDLEPLGARFAPELDLAGIADLDLRVDGSLSRPRVEVDAEVDGLEAAGISGRDIRLAAELDDDIARVDMELFHNRALIASVHTGDVGIPLDLDLERGRFGLDTDRPLALDVLVERMKLGELRPVLPESVDVATRGYVEADLQIRGSIDHPDLAARVLVNDATLEVPLGEDEWEVHRTSLEVRTVVDGSDDVWFGDVSALVAVAGREVIDLQLRTSADPEALMDDPAAVLPELAVDASVDITNLDASDVPEPIRDALDLHAGAVDGIVTWNGRMRDGIGSVTVAINGVRIGEIDPISARLDVWSESDVQVGAVVFLGEDVPELSIGGAAPSPLEGGTGIDFYAAFAASLHEIAEGGFDPSAPVEARLVVPPVTFDRLASLSPSLAEHAGRLSAYVDIFGTLGDPQAFGRVAVVDAELIDGGLGGAGVEIEYAGGVARASAFTCEGEGRGIEIGARVGVDLGLDALQVGLPPVSEWTVQAEARADGVELAQTVPLVAAAGLLDDIGGALDLDVTVGGTVGRPEVLGSATLADGRFGVIPLGRTFENVRLDVNVRSDAIELTELVVDDERGRIRALGLVTLDDMSLASAELQVRARDFLLSSSSGLGAFLTGTTDVSVVPGPEEMRIEVLLRGIEIDVPDDVGGAGGGPRQLPAWVLFEGEDVAVDQRGRRNPVFIELGEDAPVTAPMRIALHVETVDAGQIHQQLADIDFTVDLDVVAEGDSLMLSGGVRIPEGVVRVAGRDFDMRQGRIAFPEGIEGIDPAIDIEAVHELSSAVTEYLSERGYVPSGDFATISVVVRGSLSDLAADPEEAIQLVSDPRGLSEPDIFQLLASGRLSGDSDAEEGQQGLAAISSLLLGVVGDQLSGGIPIDTIRIESTGESARVEGGKYIADNLYVSGTYIRSPDDEDDNNFEVALEWILRRIGPGSLRLELRGGDRGKGGLELLYNLIRR